MPRVIVSIVGIQTRETTFSKENNSLQRVNHKQANTINWGLNYQQRMKNKQL